ncbi:MAG: hypothetical protein AB1476_05230 [Candidatus Hadarchaeota archaeon]
MNCKSFWRKQTPFTAAASASGTASSVELWYRYSADNLTWGNWRLFGVDENGADNWSWQFDAPDGGDFGF